MFRIFIMLLIPWVAFAQDIKTYIPVKAYTYLPVVKTEVTSYMPDIEEKNYFAGLIEQESCISLKHKKCWDPTSQLKTKREEGAGLGQLTRAYKEDGSVRFDSLSDMQKRYQRELKELSWSNVYVRPDLQIRTMVLMSRENYKSLYDVKDQDERLKMIDAAYNGGLGGLQKERRVCGLAKDCDPNIWFHNVEKFCMKSKKPLYGNRTACDINREHVDLIFNYRMSKYAKHF